MSSQQRVQNYLDKHRISSLFEDLMARLVQNLPTEPLPYLIKILQKFDEKAKKQQLQGNPLAPKAKTVSPGFSRMTPKVRAKDPLSKSTTSLKKDSLSKSATQLSRSVTSLPKETSTSEKGAGAATKGSYAWQPSSAPTKGADRGYQRPWVSNTKRDKPTPGIYGEDRGYERPWIANMKKIKYEQAQLKARKLRKSSSTGGAEGEGSSKSTPSSEADVEQIFVRSQEKPPQRPKTLFSPGAQAWLSEMDTGPYRPPPPKPYQPPEQVEEVFLKEELSADKLMKRYDKETPSQEAATEKQKVEQRRAKPDQKAKKHKEELAALVAAQRKVETLGYLDSGGESRDPDQGGYEEATDMLEDASDLMDEGVTDVKATGQKVRKRPPPPQTQVKVGVCSRCANVMGSGDTSTVGGGVARGYGAYTSIDSSSEVSVSSGSDFESASQVTGPRPMAWDGTTADGTRLSKSVAGRSMTHDQTSELFQSSSRFQSGGGANGRGTFRIQSSTEVRSSQRWETRSYTSETEVDPRVTTAHSLLDKGRSWPQPGSDDDSSV